MLEVLEFCFQTGTPFTLENPDSSWFWSVLALLVREKADSSFRAWFSQLAKVIYDQCEHGGQRPKTTRLLCHPGPAFANLARRCKQDHEHLPWGLQWTERGWLFATHLEAAYPGPLCVRWASCFASLAKSLQPPEPDQRLVALESLGRQTRKHPSLVPEFKFTKLLPLADVPKSGCKILQPPKKGGSAGEAEPDAAPEKLLNPAAPKPSLNPVVEVGFFHTQQEFFAKALKVLHPMDKEHALPKVTTRAIEANVKADRRSLSLRRKIAILKAESLASSLNPAEKALHASLPEWMERVVHDKRILLFKRLLEMYDFDDVGAADLLHKGVQVSGTSPCPPGYSLKLKPALYSESTLRDSASVMRQAIAAEPCRAEKALRAEVYKVTMEEAQKGWVVGPIDSIPQVTSLLNRHRWSVIRRFGVPQGAKTRPIDDCAESGLNGSFSRTMALQMQDADFFSSLCLEVSRALQMQGPSGPQEWVGRCLDLSSAYKQVPLAPEHRDLCVLQVYDPEGTPKYFLASALVFGASGSVFGFLRLGKALWHLITTMLEIPASTFFDDFPMVCPAADAEEVTSCCHKLLHLLGWRFAEIGEKALPFGVHFNVLGMRLDLSHLPAGLIRISNKVGRVDKILDRIRAISELGRLSKHEGQVIVGLLRFAAGCLGGRQLKFVCNDLDSIIHGSGDPSRDFVCGWCDRAVAALAESKPLELRAADSRKPVHIFTDGAFEDSVAGLGAVVFDAEYGWGRVLGGRLSESLLKKLLPLVGKQVISQVELIAALSVRMNLAKELAGRRVIIWLDNEAARFGLISGRSPSPSMDSLLRLFASVEDGSPSFTWICRVPSYSNLADGPSKPPGLKLLSAW